eukprot:scaffold106635_cov68-Phaeocystis_antarctica.AAC.9
MGVVALRQSLAESRRLSSAELPRLASAESPCRTWMSSRSLRLLTTQLLTSYCLLLTTHYLLLPLCLDELEVLQATRAAHEAVRLDSPGRRDERRQVSYATSLSPSRIATRSTVVVGSCARQWTVSSKLGLRPLSTARLVRWTFSRRRAGSSSASPHVPPMACNSTDTRGELTPPCTGSCGDAPLSCGSYWWQRAWRPSRDGRDSVGRGSPWSDRISRVTRVSVSEGGGQSGSGARMPSGLST